MSIAGGIFNKINEALPTGMRNYLPPGQHRLKLRRAFFKAGEHKNRGKEFFMIEAEVVATTVENNANCQPGSSVTTGFDTARYPESAIQDIKGFLSAQFSDEELAGVPRSILKANEVQQQGNPYIGGQVGITWQEALFYVTREGDDSPYKSNVVLVECEAIEKQNKTNPGKFTKVYWKKAGSLTNLGPVA